LHDLASGLLQETAQPPRVQPHNIERITALHHFGHGWGTWLPGATGVPRRTADARPATARRRGGAAEAPPRRRRGTAFLGPTRGIGQLLNRHSAPLRRGGGRGMTSLVRGPGVGVGV